MSALSYRLLLNRRGFAFMGLNGAVLAALLQACAPQVAPETMMAVIRVESAGDPFRIGVNKGGALRRQPGNAADAIATAKGLMRRGASFDAGNSEERRGGKEGVSTVRSRWSPYHSKKQRNKEIPIKT